MLNAGGSGYYRVAHAGDGLNRLLAAPDLSIGERLVLLDDARGLHGAGLLSGAQLQGLLQSILQAQAGPPPREVVELAVALLGQLRPLLTDSQQTAWAQRWQTLFGDHARALGWQPRPGETDDLPEELQELRLPVLERVAHHLVEIGGSLRRLGRSWRSCGSRLASEAAKVIG